MKNIMLFGAVALTYSAVSVAVSPDAYPEGHMTESGVVITPVIKAGFKYDDNTFNQKDDTNSSTIFTVSPAVQFSLDDGINNYNLNLAIESGTYFDSRDDDYLTGMFGFESHIEANSRSRFDIQLDANKKVEPRGTGLTEGLGNTFDEPLTYNDQLAKVTYEYGNLSSKGRIAITGKYYNKNYTNFTEITEYRSYNKPELGAMFFYSTNASTDTFFEIKASSIAYDKATEISLDSDVYSALVGIKWEVTELTSGSFKIGQEQKKFTNAAREDFKGISWDGNIEWKPLEYTAFNFNTSSSAKDPDGFGDYIKEDIYGVRWSHIWNDFITSTLDYSYWREDYSGFERLDKTNSVNVGLDYQIILGSNIDVFVQYNDKDSTYDQVVYDKSIIGINFTQFL